MDVERIIARARAMTGLDIAIEPDVLEGLATLVDAARLEARFSEIGAARWEAGVTGHLVVRLRVLDYLQRHPDLLLRPIERPTFVFGLPRTGTTLTINLLNADPGLRCLLRWEALDPVPPAAAGALSTDPRCLAEQARIDGFVAAAPQIAAAHYEAADAPSECQYAMAPSFRTQLFDSTANIPSYRHWLFEADCTPAFRFHKQLAQVLQENNTGHWTFKNPWHPLWLDDLRSVYPDAQLVMTHRDPVEVVGSACSLIRLVRPMFSDSVDMAGIATHMIETFERMIARQNAFRKEHGSGAIHDIRYADQVANPIAEMRRLYAKFEEPLTPEAESAMKRLLAEQPKGKHGVHQYSLSEFGLTAEGLRDRFKEYCDDFDI